MSRAKDVRVQTIPIELDKPRTLYFNLNSFIELEDTYGSIEAAMDEMEKGSIKAIRFFLWTGLVHEDRELKPEDVGNFIGLADLSEITAKIEQALSSSMPEQPEGTEGNLKEQLKVVTRGSKTENP